MGTDVRQKAEKKFAKPNNIIIVSTSLDTSFFKWWCVFQRPIVRLTDREIDVVASLLKQRWELSKIIKDPSILDTMTMSSDVLDKVAEECNITKQHFYVVMSALKKKGVIKGHITPKLIPNLKKEGDFKLTILFKEATQ